MHCSCRLNYALKLIIKCFRNFPSNELRPLKDDGLKPFDTLYIIYNLLNYRAMVGQTGVDPVTPEGNGFTARRSCRFATGPYGRSEELRYLDLYINSASLCL